MGHVSRSIGLIEELKANNNSIVIACDCNQRRIFEEYFPGQSFIDHDGYPFQFKGKGNFQTDLFRSFYKLKSRLSREKKQVEEYLKKHTFDVIISDHRYGFRNDEIHSVFITHQVNLPVKWYAKFVQKWHERLILQFNEIWVMDFDKNCLAGELSRKIPGLKLYYIGPYSRFMFQLEQISSLGKTVLISSGPHVYSQQFVDERIPLLSGSDTVIIAQDNIKIREGFNRISNSWKEQDEIILNASKIISRSGYSTIMDLHFLKKPFEIYPTKGQAEQQYLWKITGSSEP